MPPRAQVWELEDDAAFDAAAHELGFPGMALARELALFTAQRQSDLLAFTEHQLAALDILDSFGQRSLIRFTGMQANPALPVGTFQFKPPAGADVVKP